MRLCLSDLCKCLNRTFPDYCKQTLFIYLLLYMILRFIASVLSEKAFRKSKKTRISKKLIICGKFVVDGNSIFCYTEQERGWRNICLEMCKPYLEIRSRSDYTVSSQKTSDNGVARGKVRN